MVVQQFRDEISKLRENRGNFARLVRDSGVAEMTIRNLLREDSNPTAAVMEALAKAMGMEVWLLTEVEKRVLGQYRKDCKALIEVLHETGEGAPRGILDAHGTKTGRWNSKISNYSEVDKKPRRREEED